MKSRTDRRRESSIRLLLASASCSLNGAVPTTPLMWPMAWTPLYRLAYERAREQVREMERRARLAGFGPPSMN